jgi:hypothetical protein
MREISCFPPPDSHVSLSAVLEPGPNARPAPPPQPAPTTKQLTPKPWYAAAKTNPDRHATASHPTEATNETANPATILPRHPNRCEFATRHAASKALTRFKHQPTPPIGHDTRPTRPKSTQTASLPEPTTDEQTPDRLRKLFPPQAPASAPMQRTSSKAPNRPGLRLDTGTARTRAPTLCFSRCAATYQLKTLTEQGACEHYLAFSRR